jgi:hypothetical protein
MSSGAMAGSETGAAALNVSKNLRKVPLLSWSGTGIQRVPPFFHCVASATLMAGLDASIVRITSRSGESTDRVFCRCFKLW